jgi:hypothetical protein
MPPEDEIEQKDVVEPEAPAPETPDKPDKPEGEAELMKAVSDAIDEETPEALRAKKPDVVEPEAEKPGEKPKDPKAAKPEKPEGGKEPPAEPDHVNDAIPEWIKGKTRARMESLVGSVKSTTAERDKYRSERDELIGAIRDTGADVDTVGRTFEVLRQMHSKSPEERRQASKWLRSAADKLAEEIGDVVPGTDVLSKYPDLKQRVEAGDITAELAAELAAGRNAKAAGEARSLQDRQTTEQQQQHQAAVTAGATALNALEAQLKADPDYERKKAIILPGLLAVRETVHPSKWAAMFRAQYEKVVLPKAANGALPAEPLRGRQPAGGGGERQPGSALEAMERGLADAVRR